MASASQVLIASPDPETRWRLTNILGKRGLDLVFSSTVSEAGALLARQPICLEAVSKLGTKG